MTDRRFASSLQILTWIFFILFFLQDGYVTKDFGSVPCQANITFKLLFLSNPVLTWMDEQVFSVISFQ